MTKPQNNHTTAHFTFETFTLDALHDAYRATGDTRQPAGVITVAVGAPIPCNIGFRIRRGYVEGGAK